MCDFINGFTSLLKSNVFGSNDLPKINTLIRPSDDNLNMGTYIFSKLDYDSMAMKTCQKITDYYPVFIIYHYQSYMSGHIISHQKQIHLMDVLNFIQ